MRTGTRPLCPSSFIYSRRRFIKRQSDDTQVSLDARGGSRQLANADHDTHQPFDPQPGFANWRISNPPTGNSSSAAADSRARPAVALPETAAAAHPDRQLASGAAPPPMADGRRRPSTATISDRQLATNPPPTLPAPPPAPPPALPAPGRPRRRFTPSRTGERGCRRLSRPKRLKGNPQPAAPRTPTCPPASGASERDDGRGERI